MINIYLSLLVTGCREKTQEESQYDNQSFSIDCQALQDHFVTQATESVQDWSGFWECFQVENGCSGEACSWNIDDLPSYLTSEDCSQADTCSIGGSTIQECQTPTQTGFVGFDCTTDGEITITANGLPDHTIENYASSGMLPPLIGSTASHMNYTLTDRPVYMADSDVFHSGGGTIAIAINSVSIFNQFTGIGTVAVTDEIVDDCGGHPANGTYHYHAYPTCGALADPSVRGAPGEHSGLVGMSLDGFPIFGPYGYIDAADATSEVVRMQSCYTQTGCMDETNSSCYVFDQEAYDSGECHLDKCNGRVSAVPEWMQAALGSEIYVYYTTIDESQSPAFPFLPFCYRGDAASGSTGMRPPPPPQK